MLISLLTILAICIPIASEGRYIYSIIKGKTKPSFVAFLIFSIEMSIIFLASYSLGARESLVLVGTFTILHIVTALLALKYGYVRFSKFNIVCLVFSAIGILLWLLTDNAWYALLLEITVDIFAYLVLSRKLYICPATEDPYAWGMGIVAYGFNLVLITTWVPEEYLFSVINVFFCSVIFALSLRRSRS